jgi:hypothetical protein
VQARLTVNTYNTLPRPSKKLRARSMQPCPLPPQYEQHDAVGAMRALLALGALTHWTVGTKQGKICSRFVTGSGTEDILTAISETDRDYGQLVAAHVMRVGQLLS